MVLKRKIWSEDYSFFPDPSSFNSGILHQTSAHNVAVKCPDIHAVVHGYVSFLPATVRAAQSAGV